MKTGNIINKSNREILNFNDNWGFYRGDLIGAYDVDFDDSAFAGITLPHTMRLEKNPAGDVNDVFQGIGWYRRYFTLGAEYADERICVDFEGVMMECEVFLNGKKVGEHRGGYMEFSVDITNEIHFTESNLLAVKVVSKDNPDIPPGKPLANLDFHYYGGIYRNVYLKITNNLFITNALEVDEIAGGGIFVTYPLVKDDRAVINIKTHVQNNNSDSAKTVVKTFLSEHPSIIAENAETVFPNTAKTFEQNIELDNPKLWSPDSPNLYTLVSKVYNGDELVDTMETKIGIRHLDMKPDGFYINGKKLYLRGANRHQCYAYIGDAAPDSMQVRDVLQMKENGFNSVRAAHYPQSPAFLDACDKYGLLVIECQPGWQQFTESEVFYNNTIRDAREMIRRDRNRPSVFLWETSLNETHYSAKWAEEVTRAAHQEYPGNQLFTAADYGLQGDYYDVNYKLIDGEKDNNPDKTAFTREWGDLGGYHQWHRKDGEYFMLWQVRTHQEHLNGGGYPDWGGLDAGKRLAGHYMWSWNDYSRGYNSWMLPSGCVEADRSQKYLAFWLQSMLPANEKPMAFIASRNDFLSSQTVRVFSNCDEVELFQNGKSLGRLSRYDEPADIMLDPLKIKDVINTYFKKKKIGNFISNVKNIIHKGGSPIYNFKRHLFIRGELTAKGYTGGKEVAVHTVKSPGFAKKIDIIAYTRGIAPVADGSDLIPVYFKITDKNGSLVPYRYNKIHIAVSGEGELVGKGMERVGAEHQMPSGGMAFAFVRTTKKAGVIKITARSNHLKGFAEIETIPYCGKFVPEIRQNKWNNGMEALETDNNKEKSKDNDIIKLGKPLKRKNIESFSATCENEDNRGVEKLFDGDKMIGSGWLAKTTQLPQSVTVKFKKTYRLSACQLFWEKDSSWYTYGIEISNDGEKWTSVIEKRSVGGQETNPVKFSSDGIFARYVRITLYDVVSGGGVPRIGMSEIVLYSK